MSGWNLLDIQLRAWEQAAERFADFRTFLILTPSGPRTSILRTHSRASFNASFIGWMSSYEDSSPIVQAENQGEAELESLSITLEPELIKAGISFNTSEGSTPAGRILQWAMANVAPTPDLLQPNKRGGLEYILTWDNPFRLVLLAIAKHRASIQAESSFARLHGLPTIHLNYKIELTDFIKERNQRAVEYFNHHLSPDDTPQEILIDALMLLATSLRSIGEIAKEWNSISDAKQAVEYANSFKQSLYSATILTSALNNVDLRSQIREELHLVGQDCLGINCEADIYASINQPANAVEIVRARLRKCDETTGVNWPRLAAKVRTHLDNILAHNTAKEASKYSGKAAGSPKAETKVKKTPKIDIDMLEANTPALDIHSKDWLRVGSQEFKQEGVSSESLRTMRSQGSKNETGTFGIDKSGRRWRKKDRESQAVYYWRSTLKSKLATATR